MSFEKYVELGWILLRGERGYRFKFGEWGNITKDNFMNRFNGIKIQDYNIAVKTGKISGITVIDLDIYDTEEQKIFVTKYDLFDYCCAYTPSGGIHFFFKYNENLKTTQRGNYDIKNNGGIITLPPSISRKKIDGKKTDILGEYKWINEPTVNNIKPIPNNLMEFLKEDKPIKKSVIKNSIIMDYEIPNYKVLSRKEYEDYIVETIDLDVCPFIKRKHKYGNHNKLITNKFDGVVKLGCHDCPEEMIVKKADCLIDDDELKMDKDSESVVKKYVEEKDYFNLNDDFKVFRNKYFSSIEAFNIADKYKHTGDCYKMVKKYIEQFYFKILEPSCFMDINGSIIVPKDIGLLLGNVFYYYNKEKGNKIITEKSLFLKKWKSDPFIKTYKGFGFYPPPIKPPQGFFNTFDSDRFYQVINNPKKKECPNIIYHFENIICNKDTMIMRFFINFIYQLMKYPAKNPQVFIVFFSKVVGAGKNTFWYILFKLMNNMYCDEVDGIEYFKSNKGDHNEEEMNKILFIINEGAASSKSVIEKIKSQTTNKFNKINLKFKPKFDEYNMRRNGFTTNQEKSINVAGKTRRFGCFNINDEKIGDTEYFIKLYQEMNDPMCISNFWDYVLKNINEEDKELIDKNLYNFQQNIPITDYFKNLITSNTDNFTQFLCYFYYNNRESDNVDIKCDNMKEDYIYFIKKMSDEKFKITHKRLINNFNCLTFKNQQIIEFKKNKKLRFYRCNIRLLEDFIKNTNPHMFDNIEKFMDIIECDNYDESSESDDDD